MLLPNHSILICFFAFVSILPSLLMLGRSPESVVGFSILCPWAVEVHREGDGHCIVSLPKAGSVTKMYLILQNGCY